MPQGVVRSFKGEEWASEASVCAVSETPDDHQVPGDRILLYMTGESLTLMSAFKDVQHVRRPESDDVVVDQLKQELQQADDERLMQDIDGQGIASDCL